MNTLPQTGPAEPAATTKTHGSQRMWYSQSRQRRVAVGEALASCSGSGRADDADCTDGGEHTRAAHVMLSDASNTSSHYRFDLIGAGALLLAWRLPRSPQHADARRRTLTHQAHLAAGDAQIT
jgi:hypothetical protein